MVFLPFSQCLFKPLFCPQVYSSKYVPFKYPQVGQARTVVTSLHAVTEVGGVRTMD